MRRFEPTPEQVQLGATLLIVVLPSLLHLASPGTPPAEVRVRSGRSAATAAAPRRGFEPLEGDFAEHWGKGANPFRVVLDRKPLDPPDLPMPPVPALPAVALPPLPLPAAQHLGLLTQAVGKQQLGSGGKEKDDKGKGDARDQADDKGKGVPGPGPGRGGAPGAGKGAPPGPGEAKARLAHLVRASDRVVTSEQPLQYVEGQIIDHDPCTGTVRLRLTSPRGSLERTFLRKDYVRVEPRRDLAAVYAEELERQRQRPERLRGFADECRALGLHETAARAYDLLLAFRPKDAGASLALGKVRESLGQYEEAALAYLRASEGGGADWRVLSALGRLQLEVLGLARSARRSLEAAVRREPGNAALWRLVARCALADGDAAGAAQASEKAIALDKEDGAARLDLGLAQYRSGRFKPALATLGDLAAHPETRVASRALQILGCIRYARGELAGAYDHFLAALALAPGDPELLYDAGVTLLRNGDLGKARDYLEKAREASFTDPSFPLLALGRLEHLEGKLREADDRYSAALKANPSNHLLYYYWVLLLDDLAGKAAEGAADPASGLSGEEIAKGFRDTALDYLRTLLASHFDFTEALMLTGKVLLDDGRGREAARYFEEALARRPSELACVHLGRARLFGKDVGAAASAYRRALRLADDYIHAREGLAYCANRRRNVHEARERFWEIRRKSQYAAGCLAIITDNLGKWQWEDRFSRGDDQTLHRRWVEKEDAGANVYLAGGRARIAGPSHRDWGLTCFGHLVDPRLFVSFRAVLDVSQIPEGVTVGIAVLSSSAEIARGRAGGLLFGLGEKGKLAHAVFTGEHRQEWTPLATPIESPGAVGLEIRFEGKGVTLLYGAQRVAEGVEFKRSFGGPLWVGVFAMARKPDGASWGKWSLAVSQARFVFRG